MTEDRKKRLIIMAGMFGVTNIGMSIPELRLIKSERNSLDMPHAYNNAREAAGEAGVQFAAQYIENDDMEKSFRNEAKSWYSKLSKMKDNEIRRIWPDMVDAYENASLPNPHGAPRRTHQQQENGQ